MNLIPICKARLERNLACNAYDVHVLARQTPTGVETLMPFPPLAVSTSAYGVYSAPNPAFQLDEQSAQALLDALWEAGIRPSSGQQVTGAGEQVVSLMKEHIADLRRIAFPPMPTFSPDQPQQHSTF